MCLSNYIIDWDAVSAVAGAISAIAALGTIQQSRKAANEVRDSFRPYFLVGKPGIVEKSGINQVSESNYLIWLPSENKGVHVAASLEGRVFIVSECGTVFLDNSFSVANDVQPNLPSPWSNDLFPYPPENQIHYVMLGIKYFDPILKKSFQQVFFMRWDGIRNGLMTPDFVHATKDERLQLERKYSNFIEKYC